MSVNVWNSITRSIFSRTKYSAFFSAIRRLKRLFATTSCDVRGLAGVEQALHQRPRERELGALRAEPELVAALPRREPGDAVATPAGTLDESLCAERFEDAERRRRRKANARRDVGQLHHVARSCAEQSGCRMPAPRPERAGDEDGRRDSDERRSVECVSRCESALYTRARTR